MIELHLAGSVQIHTLQLFSSLDSVVEDTVGSQCVGPPPTVPVDCVKEYEVSGIEHR